MTTVLSALAPRWDGPVVAALEGSGQVRIARRCADLADLLAAAAAGHGRVALVGADLRGLSLSAIARLHEVGVAVVGVSDPGDEATELRLWQLGVAAVVEATAAPPDLVAAVLAAAQAPGVAEPDPTAGDGFAAGPEVSVLPVLVREQRGRVLAVWGPAGAPGRTTVAVNLAVELATLGHETLLVDADTYGGCVAQTLSVLDEAPGIAAAARSADLGTLDLVALARLALVLGPRLRVLTGIPTASRWTEIRGAALERVLDVGRSLAAWVVVDVAAGLEDDEELSYDTLAPRRNQATLSVLDAADALVAVGGCDPVSLQRFVRGLQELGTVRAPTPLVVVNRVRPGAIGSDPERQVRESLARFAGVGDLHVVPDDPVALDAAMLAGRALAECAPTAPSRRALAALAARLAGAGDHVDAGHRPAGSARRTGLLGRRGDPTRI